MRSLLGRVVEISALCSVLFLGQLAAEVIDVQVANGMDDVEERINKGGQVRWKSSDLEMTKDENSKRTYEQIVGIRFPGLAIPQGATIIKAYIQFFVDEDTNEDPVNLNIYAQDSADAPAFTTKNHALSSLPKLANSISWNPPQWHTIDAHGPDQQTSDLTSLVQEIVNKPHWNSGNAMAFIIDGTGTRVARSSDRHPAMAPILHVEYTTGTVTPPQQLSDVIIADYRLDKCTFDGSDGDVTDETGSFDAASKNGVVSVDGTINKAASLSADNDYIALPTLPSGTFDRGVTVSAWVNFDDVSKNDSKYEHIVNLSSGLCDDVNGEWCANDYISLWRDGSNNTIRFKMRQGTQSAGNHPHATALSGWHLYTGSFDADTGKAKIYVDGVLKDTQDWNTTTFNPDAVRDHNYIGKTIWDGRDGNLSSVEYPFSGKVDEVKLFNGALSDAQVAQIYANEHVGKNYDGSTREALVCEEPQSDLPTLSIEDANCTEGNTGTTDCQFHVNLSSGYSKNVSVTYGTSDTTAEDGSDYTAAVNSQVTISAGQTSAVINIPIIGDTDVEGNETFEVMLDSATAGTDGASADLPQPLAWYKFDETGYSGTDGEVQNSGSVTGADGKAVNGTTTTPDAKAGNAALFDGVDDMMTFGDVLNPGATDQWTISGWINWDGTGGGTQQIVGKDHVYQVVIDNSGHLKYALSPHWAFDGGNSFSVNPGEWVHFTLTYDGAEQKLYKNGTLVYTRAQSGNIGTSANPLTIGAFHNGNFAYTGKIDDIRMYDQALSEVQVQTLAGGESTQNDAVELDITDGTAIGMIINDDNTTPVQNHKPTASDFNLTVDQNSNVSFTLKGSDEDNNATLTYYIVSDPSHGSITTDSLPQVTYTPDSGFNGTDIFKYVVSDGDLNSSEATVTIHVKKVETSPQTIQIDENTTSGVGCAGQGIKLAPGKNVEINGTISEDWQSDRYSFLASAAGTLHISVQDENGNPMEYYVIRNCYEQIKQNDDGTYTLPQHCGLVTIMVVGCKDGNSDRKYTVTVSYQQ